METQNKQKRVESLNLLKVFLTVFVIILHLNNTHGGKALLYSVGFNKEIVLVFEAITICAVNCFILISGYFLSSHEKRDISKIIYLIITVSFFNFMISLCLQLFNISPLSIKQLIISLIPSNYFIWLYGVLYIISPYINKCIGNLDKDKFSKFMILSIILFSVWPTMLDCITSMTGVGFSGMYTINASSNEGGYTLVWFVVLYCSGAYLRKYSLNEKNLYIFAVISIILIYLLLHVTVTVINYDNILVYIASITIFSIFNKIKLKESKIIYMLSKRSFDIYVIHCCLYVLWTSLNLKRIYTSNFVVFIIYYVAMFVIMYLVSLVISIIGDFLLYPVRILVNTCVNKINIQLNRYLDKKLMEEHSNE